MNWVRSLGVVVLMASVVMDTSRGQPGVRDAVTASPIAGVQKQIANLAAMPSLHTAFDWFRSNARQLSEWQLELTSIPAPPFSEAKRAEWLKGKFQQLGLKDVHIDQEGNVLGLWSGENPAAKHVLLSAHLDTVFPPGTHLPVRREGEKLIGPGISDNGAGLTAILAIAAALRNAQIETEAPILFVANVGEEGEGDLRGIRYLFNDSKWSESIGYAVILDGGGSDSIVAEGLGSRRFLVSVNGPGGHSWSDFGTPNPIMVLARAIDTFSRTPVPANPKATFNIGTISGGTSVNSIPESASIKVDIRSSSPAELERIERSLTAALEQAILPFRPDGKGADKKPVITYDMNLIGNRPAAKLDPDAHILEVVRAVDSHLRIPTRIQRASTDANIPLSMGREAVTLGGGGTGGGAHTLHEWYDPTDRDLGLRRILLSVLALAGVAQ
ncbi:MAG TPA: M20/M25/M40 family metallo-hydrolase [Terriglobales bacterium]|nr:M20/M25/M40 family metallo-hydrolase [Terriglobales bacterium]